MSSARIDNAARDLLVRLTDEADLEFTPLEEVRADLAWLGIDPERVIRFSRRLAAEAMSPAAGLLAKTLMAETDDRDVSQLESADLIAVRAQLSAADLQAAARTSELARQATKRPPSFASRRLWYGIGGAITALAASVLIVATLSSPELGFQQTAYAPAELPASTMRSREEQAAPIGAPAAQTTTTGALGGLPVSSGATEPSRGDSADKSTTQSARVEDLRDESGLVAVGAQSEVRQLSQVATQTIFQDGASDLPVVAALILQPELAPEPLRQAGLDKGELASQLPSAARSVAKTHVVALLTLQRADGATFSYMLLRFPIKPEAESNEPAVQSETAPAALPVPLPEDPTLGQLLGRDAVEFRLLELPAQNPGQ